MMQSMPNLRSALFRFWIERVATVLHDMTCICYLALSSMGATEGVESLGISMSSGIGKVSNWPRQKRPDESAKSLKMGCNGVYTYLMHYI